MSASSRIEKSMLNVLTGVFGQMLSFVLSFAIRTVFIKTLGEVYLGLNGLYSNILSVLNLTELGLGTAIVIELYRTVAQKDQEKTKQYLDLYKKAYFVIGMFILIIGVTITPFLQYFINDAESLELINYKLVFVLYLLNTVFSYFFFAYRESILQANQQEYKLRIITYIFKLIEMILQIITLVIWKNIYLYLVIPLILGCISTVVKGVMIGKWFPFILEKPKGRLTSIELKDTVRNIYSVALYKISGTVMNSTDNIILSSYISIIITGLYSNYLILTSAVTTILSKVFNAFTASIGNLNAEESENIEKKYNVFQTLSFLNFWVYGFCAVCFFVLFTPFISVWLGPEYVLNPLTEAAIAIKFLFFGLQETIGVHRAAYGLFYKGRYRPIFTVIINIITSIIFVQVFPEKYGVVAVLLGTILSNLCVGWWFDVYLIYKHIFKRKPWEFYVKFWLRLIYVLGCCALFKGISIVIPIGGILGVLINLGVCCVLYNAIFIIIFKHNLEFKYAWNSIQTLLKKLVRKL